MRQVLHYQRGDCIEGRYWQSHLQAYSWLQLLVDSCLDGNSADMLTKLGLE